MRILKKYGFSICMLLALVIGTIIGLFASNDFVANISPLGDIFVNLMFTLVVPLVFFTITSSIANMDKKAKLSKILTKTVIIFIITSIISTIVAIVGVLIVNPTGNVTPVESDPVTPVGFLQAISEAITVTDFFNLLSKSHMLALIIFSIILGICIRKVDKEGKISRGLEVLSNAFLKFVKIVMYYAPIGVCAFFATLVKSYGGEILTSYLRTLLIYIGICIVYFFVFYTLYAFIAGGKNGIKNFYRNIFRSVVTSLATQSSLASLPSNMEVADDMKIDKTISKVSLPLASTIHMEGSSVASILKIFFLFSIFNMPINGISTYLIALLIAVASGVVMSGIPGGGLIGEMLIVSLYGFPASAFTMIATIGWLVDAPATMLNVCGDIPSTMLIEKFVNRRKKTKLEKESVIEVSSNEEIQDIISQERIIEIEEPIVQGEDISNDDIKVVESEERENKNILKNKKTEKSTKKRKKNAKIIKKRGKI
ncbi:MAG: dicarboxylate/amino acid:cation symporter [Candidatus Caccovivens sp.]